MGLLCFKSCPRIFCAQKPPAVKQGVELIAISPRRQSRERPSCAIRSGASSGLSIVRVAVHVLGCASNRIIKPTITIIQIAYLSQKQHLKICYMSQLTTIFIGVSAC